MELKVLENNKFKDLKHSQIKYLSDTSIYILHKK